MTKSCYWLQMPKAPSLGTSGSQHSEKGNSTMYSSFTARSIAGFCIYRTSLKMQTLLTSLNSWSINTYTLINTSAGKGQGGRLAKFSSKEKACSILTLLSLCIQYLPSQQAREVSRAPLYTQGHWGSERPFQLMYLPQPTELAKWCT